jgi:ATF/CREB family transcription factor
MSGSDDGEPEPEDYEDDGHNETRKDGKKMTDEEKRKNFLERNRVAALKCRQRKKQWLANLQAKVEMYGTENDALNATVQSLREEIVSLKTLLLAHKDCPVARANGVQLDIATLAASGPPDYGHVSMIQPYSGMMSGVLHQQNPAERRYS